MPLRAQVSDATWMASFDCVQAVEVDDVQLTLSVPSVPVRDRLDGRFRAMVEDVMEEVVGHRLALSLLVRPAPRYGDFPANHKEDMAYGADSYTFSPDGSPHRNGSSANAARDTRPGPAAASHPSDHSPGGERAQAPAPDQGPGSTGPAAGRRSRSDNGPRPNGEEVLNEHYSFETFVTGHSNYFAHAAAQRVAETPAKAFNPLFIYGESGLGKTHLLHAIGNYVRQNFPTFRIRYVSTESFMNEFVESIRTNSGLQFKRRYRACEVLLVDDIQFLENKEGLQEEFFHTFNTLHETGKQIVLTSDRPPKSIATLEDRLRSRFESGLTTDIQPPELETRLAILRQKAVGERPRVPDEVLEFIASNVKANIRELEGALIRVSAFASIHRQPLTVDLTQTVLADVLAAGQPRQITAKVIIEAAAKTFGFTPDELCGSSRRRPLVNARQTAMYAMRDLTDFSYPAIAREFGGRDHTTVIHAVDKIAKLMSERRQVYEQVTSLLQKIRSGEL